MANSIISRVSLGCASVLLGLLVSAGCGSSAQTSLPTEADDPSVVAVFDDEVLTLDEFERRYARSSGSGAIASNDSLTEYQDFLERYVDFRLKVLAAEEAGFMDSPEIQAEIATYKTSLARPYLLEREVLEPIVRMLYERRKAVVDVSHILLRTDPDASPEDTLQAYRRLRTLRDSALQSIDFGDLAFRHSDDPSARRNADAPGYRGRLGYLSAGRAVEPFETHAYETQPGGISDVFRTRFGYHILKVHDRREAQPSVRISHIMIRPQPTAQDSAAARELIRGLKQQIDEGADFAELAKQHSHDLQSRAQGGDIGLVSFDAPIHESFKKAAFALEEVGDVSDVVETPYGFHLIKVTDREQPKSFEESFDELKQIASRLPRTTAAEERLAADVIREQGARVDTSAVLDALAGMPADSVIVRLVARRLPSAALADTFFVIGDSAYAIVDLAVNAGRMSRNATGDAKSRALAVLSDFLTRTAIDFEAARLEDRDPEFRRLMDEFRDGLVLFEFMEDSVWTAAERDSAALEAHYRAHADKYRWPERTRVIGLTSPSDSLLELAAERLRAGAAMETVFASLSEDTLNTIRMDTTMIADSTNSVYDRALEVGVGEMSGPHDFRGGYVLLLNDGVEAPRRKTFEEARMQVVSEHQKVLEDRLRRSLRRRYNARTFPERLVNAYERAKVQNEATTASSH